MATWFIGVVGLRLCWTSFFDDFTLLSKKVCAESAAIAAEGLFSLLGIDYAKEGKKAVPWDTKVKALGVVIDLSPEGSADDAAGRFVTIGHTASRVEELQVTLGAILEKKRCQRKKQSDYVAGCSGSKASPVAGWRSKRYWPLVS
jgi:hypothetical protein